MNFELPCSPSIGITEPTHSNKLNFNIFNFSNQHKIESLWNIMIWSILNATRDGWLVILTTYFQRWTVGHTYFILFMLALSLKKPIKVILITVIFGLLYNQRKHFFGRC